MPDIAIKVPHNAYQPVDRKRKSQIDIERITGTGKRNILKGRFLTPVLFLNKATPMLCPMNWTNMRMARMDDITSLSFINKLKTKPSAQRKISET